MAASLMRFAALGRQPWFKAGKLGGAKEAFCRSVPLQQQRPACARHMAVVPGPPCFQAPPGASWPPKR